MNPHTDPVLLGMGEERLRRLLPQARRWLRNNKSYTVKTGTGLSGAMAPYLVEANFKALVVYPAPLGGWHADLLLHSVPLGVTNSVGSPVATPLRSKKDAEEFALKLLATALTIEKEVKAGAIKASEPVFQLGPLSVGISTEFFERVKKEMPEALDGFGDQEMANAAVGIMVGKLFPAGITQEAFDALDDAERTFLSATLHGAVLAGVFTYPARRDGTPSGLDESASKATH